MTVTTAARAGRGPVRGRPMSGRTTGGQVTIADVARHAGAAASTVSYVLSGTLTCPGWWCSSTGTGR
ncbi:LacI family DNA-binding transcriptional regulator [Micromonospora yasonensis]|uniref:LacI family DNA-binding transcriptional regulator n=1 Tax=Micromonospora yasonensis TaxID=1128667 RepID=UPI002232469F|nr:LacI family DNA-binding transcriptional regulator [Micromonospora yasonensis]MCW3844448.1 LacI family DNA-binding transcriptional regulator [Micromonospora yasonensis]